MKNRRTVYDSSSKCQNGRLGAYMKCEGDGKLLQCLILIHEYAGISDLFSRG